MGLAHSPTQMSSPPAIRARLRTLRDAMRYFSPRSSPRQVFLLITRERSGSTAWMDLVGRHPELLCDPHDFLAPQRWFPELDRKRTLYTTRPTRGYKLKICYDYLAEDAESVRHFLLERQQHGIRLVRFYRKNLLRQALSSAMVKATGQLHQLKGSEQKRERRRIDIQNFKRAAIYMQGLSEFEEAALQGVPHLSLAYEESLEKPENTPAATVRFFEYLGLKPMPVDTQYRKPPVRPLHETVANPEEVMAVLRELPFADPTELDQAAGVNRV